MASPFLFISFFFLLCSIFPPSEPHSTNPFTGGFAISLIHRDSPHSPLYNDSMTNYDRRLRAAHRSVSRLKRLHPQAASKNGPPDVSSVLFPDDLEYIMSYYIGTPSIKLYAFADSGSDLIWTKGIPYFEPSKSFSYTNLSCDAYPCNALGADRKTCFTSREPCTYQIMYADHSTTAGVLADDKFTFEDSNRSIVDVGFLHFGYSFISSPHFKGHENGCMGLNRDPLSLISQLGIQKFSHCMVFPDDQGTASRMYFGSKAAISGSLTPFYKGRNWHYYVTLEGITIGDQKVPIPPGAFNLTEYNDGGVIIDSGTAYTMLTTEGFEPFLKMMRQNVHLPITRGPEYFFELCFEGAYEDLRSLPFVTFHFTGADVMLMKETTFVELEKGLWCLAIIRSGYDLSISGNIQMRNLWVGYDIVRQLISFAPVDCATTV